MVECSFRTEFKDHLFISMDAEIILFIHDLITSYMQEKDSGNGDFVFSAHSKTYEYLSYHEPACVL